MRDQYQSGHNVLSKMSSFQKQQQQQNRRHVNKQENMMQRPKINKQESGQQKLPVRVTRFIREDLKVANVSMFEELKETMTREKEDIPTVSYQIENINKETEFTFKNQMGFLEF